MSKTPKNITRANAGGVPRLQTRTLQAVRIAQFSRYSKLRPLVFTVLLGLSTLLVVGCPARWKAVFINGSGQHLSVQLSGALDGKTRGFTLSEGGSHSEHLEQVQRLAVFAPSGNLLFEREGFGNKYLAPPLLGKYPHIYILLTTTNAYVIPPDFAKTWREHINEITKPRA